MQLDGTVNGYVDMGGVYAFQYRADFSLQAWVSTTATGGSFAAGRHKSGSANGYFIALNDVGDGAGDVASHFYQSGSCDAASSQTVNDGSWHQLVAVHDGGVGTYYYVDGVRRDSAAAQSIIKNTGARFMVGGIMVGSTPSGGYNGLIDEVRVYDHALSESEVSQLYQSYTVPEPTSALLLAWGLLAALGRRRVMPRRRRCLAPPAIRAPSATAPAGRPDPHLHAG